MYKICAIILAIGLYLFAQINIILPWISKQNSWLVEALGVILFVSNLAIPYELYKRFIKKEK